MPRRTLHRIRRRAAGQRGFTLIELLVVILIIGILAAIAIPSFLNQKTKARDAGAKELAHNAATAMETWATDNNGTYTGVTTPGQLQTIDPSVNLTNTPDAQLITAVGSTNGYTIVTQSPGGSDTFSIVKSGNSVTYPCAGADGGCPNGSWG